MTTFEELNANAPHPNFQLARASYWREQCRKLLEQDTRPKPTKAQGIILSLIKDHIERYGIAPSFRELAERTNSHISVVSSHIGGLEQRGYINRIPGHKRSISVIQFPSHNNVD